MSAIFNKTFGLLCVFVPAFLASAALYATAAEIKTPVLQFREGRFYFPAGREALVYPNSGFVIIADGDTAFSGKIEMSSLGVSFSFPVEHDLDDIHINAMTAVIETVEIDGTSSITLGTVYFNQDPYSPMFPDLFGQYSAPQSTAVFFTEQGNAINVRRYISAMEMQLDFEAGILDGYFSYDKSDYCDFEITTSSSPAPYFIALLPNLATLYNQRGLLTSSLYYRVNDINPGTLFGGDGLTMQNSPTATGDTCPRPLEYNPVKGQQLLNVLKPFDAAVRLASTEREFQPTAMYFADILWREKVETRLQLGRSGSDLYIAPVPLMADSVSLSLEYIRDFLARDTVAGRSINKNIQLLNNYIKEIYMADSPDRKLDYAARSAELLWQDLGVFALYRPRVYFVHRGNIGRAEFDKDGYMNLCKLFKLRLPGAF